MPPKQRPDGSWYPIKWKCFRSGCPKGWGDERDLVEKRYPGISREAVNVMIRDLLAEYRRRFPTTLTILGERKPDPDQVCKAMAEYARTGKLGPYVRAMQPSSKDIVEARLRSILGNGEVSNGHGSLAASPKVGK
jgi:hypothetical protein